MQKSLQTGGRWRRALFGQGLAAAALASLAVPATAAAQDWSGPAWEVDEPAPRSTAELTAYAGAVFPMSMLGVQGDSLQSELSVKPSFAASVEVWLGRGFGIGVMGGLASPELSVTIADTETGEQERTALGSVDYLHAEALVLWRPELTGSATVLLPYFGAGVGVRRFEAPEDSGFGDTTDPAFVLNMGAQVRVSDTVHFRLDVRNLISSFEGGPFEASDTQHDVFAQVGFGIGL